MVHFCCTLRIRSAAVSCWKPARIPPPQRRASQLIKLAYRPPKEVARDLHSLKRTTFQENLGFSDWDLIGEHRGTARALSAVAISAWMLEEPAGFRAQQRDSIYIFAKAHGFTRSLLPKALSLLLPGADAPRNLNCLWSARS